MSTGPVNQPALSPRRRERKRTLLVLLAVCACLFCGELAIALSEQAALGLGLIAIGVAGSIWWRRRRVRSQLPHCRFCGYVLVHQCERCPECGNPIGDQDRVFCEIVYNPWAVPLGLGLIFLGGGLTWHSLQNINWVSRSPTSVLVWRLERRPSSGGGDLAWELLERWPSVSAPLKSRAIDTCVALASKPVPPPAYGVERLVSRAIRENAVSSKQAGMLCARLVHGTAVKRRVNDTALGWELDLEIIFNNAFAGDETLSPIAKTPDMLWVTVGKVETRTGGEWRELDWHPVLSGAVRNQHGLGRDRQGDIQQVKLRYSLFYGTPRDEAGSARLYDGVIDLTPVQGLPPQQKATPEPASGPSSE